MTIPLGRALLNVVLIRMVPSTLTDLLKICFSDEQWEWLERDPSFRSAVQSIKTLEDVQNLSRTGAQLIRFAGSGKPPTQGQLPAEPGNAQISS